MGTTKGLAMQMLNSWGIEKLIYHCQAKHIVENQLSSMHFMYTGGGKCTGTLSSLQHRIQTATWTATTAAQYHF